MECLSEKKEISNYIIQSSEDEIKRIALELHEGVGQTLYSVFTGMQLLEANMTDHESKRHVHEMKEVLEKTIQEIRFLSVELHPPTLSSFGFLPALKSYVNLYKATYGILVEVVQVGQEILLPERHRIMLFRVCQEALGNIAKYADTHQVEIKVNWEKDHVEILICDDGIGFDVELNRHKQGLAVMHERMNLIGGNCVIASTLGKGTKIQLKLPLQ